MNRIRMGHDMQATVALADSGLRGITRSKLTWLALAASAIHIAIRVAIITFLSIFAPAEIGFLFNATFFIGTIALQALPFVIVGAVVGSGVTARDRMMGGLEFLLSKALPPWGYVAGRIAPPTAAALALLAAPILLLNLLLLALVRDLPANANTIMWGSFAMAILFSLALGPLAAGLGTLTENPRRAVALWLGVVWLTLFLAPFAFELGVGWWWAFSPIITLQSVGSTFIGEPFPTQTGLWFAWLLIALFVVVPAVLLWYRTREVVR